MQKLEGQSQKLGYRVKVRPGVPDAGATVSLEIELAELLATAHPVYGKRRPLDDAQLRVILVAPTDPKAKKKTTAWAEAHKAVKLPDAGTYGVSFTAPTAGIYGLYLRGTTGAG